MSNTLKQIEQRKRQLGDLKGNADVISAKAEPPEPVAAAAAAPAIGKSALVGPQKPMPAPPSDKAATIAALQVCGIDFSGSSSLANASQFSPLFLFSILRLRSRPDWTRSG